MRGAFKGFLCVAAALAGVGCDAGSDQPADVGRTGTGTVLTERLAAAAFEGNRAAVEAMLPSVDVDARDEAGRTMLMLASFEGHSTTVRLLCENDANPNLRDMNRRTALMYAASGPNTHTVEILLAHGAQVNLTDGDEGWTALMFAAAEGHADIVTMLLGNGADPALMDIDGESAAYFARSNGHGDVAAQLEESSAP